MTYNVFSGTLNPTQSINQSISRTTSVGWHQKGKPIWILVEHETMRWWGGSGISWTTCKSFASHSRVQTDNHDSTLPHKQWAEIYISLSDRGLAAAPQVEKDYAKTTRVLYTPTNVHTQQQGLTYLDFTQVQTFVPVSKVLLHPTQHRHSVIDDSHRNNLTRFIAKTGWLCIRHPKDLQMILQKITVQHNRSKT